MFTNYYVTSASNSYTCNFCKENSWKIENGSSLQCVLYNIENNGDK